MAGMQANMTKVINHPIENAMEKPAMNIPIVIIIEEFFYPRAPWKLKQSVANFEESYD
jgi:hypothetical protein